VKASSNNALNAGHEKWRTAFALRVFVFLLGLTGPAALSAADQGKAEPAPSRFTDPNDGWLDASEFLDTAYGFIPVVAPITEPAVGYGAVGALVFVDREPTTQGQRYARPNIAAVGGLATENETRGVFGAHLGTWLDGRFRTLVAVADMDVNLEFFGLGSDRNPDNAGVDYGIAAQGGVAGGSYRLGETPWWFGARYSQANTRVTFDATDPRIARVAPEDRNLRIAALTPSLTLDMRDNFFTPTQGWYVDLSAPLYREALGSDRDFETLSLLAMHYRPLSRSLFLSVRGGAKTSSDGTPFYLRPYVWLRGVQVLSYQGEQAAEAEAELRWQLHSRFSLVGFAGAGIARSENATGDREETVAAGGGGFRYLLARKHGLHMGLDVAFGPDNPVLYVVFGSAWMRP
jgi:hypothetical protein